MVLRGFTFEEVEELSEIEIPEDSRQYRAINNPYTPLKVNGQWDWDTISAIMFVFGLADNLWHDLQACLEIEVTGEIDWNTVTELQRRSLIAPDGEWNETTIKGIQAALNSGILF
jgi:hypothetical protein